jgi:transglutaminase-like putative cysteine protease
VAYVPPTAVVVVVDAVVLTGLLVLAASPLAEAYGGWRWAAAVIGGAAGGLGIVLLARRWSLGAWPMVLAAAGWYFLLGPALAVPTLALGGAAPGPDSLRALVSGIVESWRDSLTGVPPLGSTDAVLVVPFVIGLVAALVGATMLWRTRRPAWAAAVVVLVLLVASAFGDRVSPPDAVRGVAVVAVLLVWLRFRALHGLKVNWLRRIGGVVAVLAVAFGGAAGLHLATDEAVARAVLRDEVEPPFDPLDYPSPLSRYRAYTKDLEKVDLFMVRGLPADVPIRLATMDRFDGIVWNVGGDGGESSRFRRVRPPVGEPTGQQVVVSVVDYTGVWVPSLGVTASATSGTDDRGATGLVGNDSGTLAQVGGAQAGTTYRLDAVRSVRPTDPEIRAAGAGPTVFVPPTKVPEVLMKRVQEWTKSAGATSAGAAAVAIAEAFHKQGFYSDGLRGEVKSPSGHGTSRVAQLVTRTQMIGNDEQYASAMAMAMQQLGAPARVVLGFTASDGAPVQGHDVTAWVEVDLAGLGWVSFEPTPPQDQTPPDQQQDPEPLPQPQVLQPVDPPQEPEDLEQDAPQGAGTTPQPPATSPIDALVDTLAWGGRAAALTLPIWLIPLVKLVRRRRRRRRRDPLARVSGGWREVTDRARDLGTSVPVGATRVESGVLMTERYPSAASLALATTADRHVFGLGEPTEAEVADYWRDVSTALRRMRKDTAWWRRPLAWFSLGSIPWRSGLRRGRTAVTNPVRRGATWIGRQARSVRLPRRSR